MDSTLEVSHDGGSLKAYLAQPQGKAPFPAILVLHEWVGLDAHVRDVADRLAAEGYLALAPDLYDGNVTSDAAEAERLMNAYYPEAPPKVMAAYDALAARDDVSKVGCMGMSMGGSLALGLAVSQPKLGGCVTLYGLPEEFFGKLGSVRCPVLGFYAELDQWVPVEQVKQLDNELHDAAVAHDVVIYPGTDHDFFNDQGATYQAEAAQETWRRTLLFFGEHLR
jgi:carboxymethylenebutenolidase